MVVLLKVQSGFCRIAVLALLSIISSSGPVFAQARLSIGVQSTLPSFQLNSGPTTTQSLTVLSNWDFPFLSGHWTSGNVSVCVYMSSPMKGTGNNTDTIPAGAVRVTPNGGSPSSIVTGSTNCGVASAYPVVTNVGISLFGLTPETRTQNGYRQDTVGISISGYPSNLEPDTYTGTINLILTVQ